MKKKIIIFALALSMLTSSSVPAAAKTPVLNKKKLKMQIGESYRLKVKNKGKKTIKWSSTKKKIASVNKKGVVTAKKKGNAKIRAKIGRKTLFCKVTIKKADTDAKVTASPSGDVSTTQSPKPKKTATPTPKPKKTATPTPKPTKKPAKPTATPDPNSIVNKPTENPKTKDDGWVPGWY